MRNTNHVSGATAGLVVGTGGSICNCLARCDPNLSGMVVVGTVDPFGMTGATRMRKLFSARARVGVEREPASYGSTGLQADKEMLPHHFRGGITRVSTAFSLKAVGVEVKHHANTNVCDKVGIVELVPVDHGICALTNQGKRRLKAVRLSDGLGLAFAGRRSLHVNDLLVSPDK